ncbi:MAG: hemin uptake protein HemP [Burkholderiales bacterium]|nr:hemin uptake protein HemP [Burkholderiales bacterium]
MNTRDIANGSNKSSARDGDRDAPAAGTVAGKMTRISSDALFKGGFEIEIMHNGSVYRLRQTSLGKLILTK